MKQYRIFEYVHCESKKRELFAVKEGFSWPGFFFGLIWFAISLLKYGRFLGFLLPWGVVLFMVILIIDYNTTDGVAFFLGSLLAVIFSHILFGFFGNKLLVAIGDNVANISNDKNMIGYNSYKRIVLASTKNAALEVYKQEVAS